MDKNLLEKAQALMIALIQNRNNLKTKTKRAFALLLMLFILAPMAAWAQFGGGSGTESSPYIIATTDHMDALASLVNGGNNCGGSVEYLILDQSSISGKDFIGGIAGTIDNATINSCINRSSITATVESYFRGTRLGGIVGETVNSNIMYCENSGKVTRDEYGGPT